MFVPAVFALFLSLLLSHLRLVFVSAHPQPNPSFNISLPSSSKQTVHFVQVGVGSSGLGFSPETIGGVPGDLITFQFHGEGHTASEATARLRDPCNTEGGFDTGVEPDGGEGSIIVSTGNSIYVFCRPHCHLGEVMIVNPGPNDSVETFRQAAMGTSPQPPQSSPPPPPPPPTSTTQAAPPPQTTSSSPPPPPPASSTGSPVFSSPSVSTSSRNFPPPPPLSGQTPSPIPTPRPSTTSRPSAPAPSSSSSSSRVSPSLSLSFSASSGSTPSSSARSSSSQTSPAPVQSGSTTTSPSPTSGAGSLRLRGDSGVLSVMMSLSLVFGGVVFGFGFV